MPADPVLATGLRSLVRPDRAGGRLTRSPGLLAALAARLTARDRWLLRMLHEHRVLTTTHITQLAFGTPRAATARLLALYQLRAIDRFRPLAPSGSAPLHFVLDEAGAYLLAAEDGITPGQLGYRRDRALAIALSVQLAHATGTNSVFCALAAQGRRAGNAALTCWWSERRCAALWGDLARPDGYGQWTEHTPAGPAVTDFFLEYDTGSENLHRVAAKLTGYQQPGRPHRHHHPRPVLAAHRPPRGRPAGTPGQHRRPRRPGGAASWRGPRRARRHHHTTSRRQRRRASRAYLAARRAARPTARTGPGRRHHARPAPRHGRRRAGRGPRPAWHRPALASPRPRATAPAGRSRHASSRRRNPGRAPQVRSHPDSGSVQVTAAIAAALVLLAVAFLAAGAGILGQAAAACQAQPPASTAAATIPAAYLADYKKAGTRYGIPWTVLAGIGEIESGQGRSDAPGVHSGVNPAGAAGPMQFGIGGLAGNTWGGAPVHPASEHTGGYGIDGDHDGIVNVYDPGDAIPSAAAFLKAHGAPADLQAALFAYNHSSSYVTDVLDWAARYAAGGTAGTHRRE